VAKRTTSSGKQASSGGKVARGDTVRAGDSAGAAVPVDPALMQTQRMCERRRFREKDVSIARMVNDIGRQAKRDVERSGATAEAWRACMPAELVEETWIESASPAQLLVGVASSPAAYAVDRALRAGALAELRRVLHAPGLRVRTRIGKSPAAELPEPHIEPKPAPRGGFSKRPGTR
jgi:hypothetical protein